MCVCVCKSDEQSNQLRAVGGYTSGHHSNTKTLNTHIHTTTKNKEIIKEIPTRSWMRVQTCLSTFVFASLHTDKKKKKKKHGSKKVRVRAGPTGSPRKFKLGATINYKLTASMIPRMFLTMYEHVGVC